MPKKAILLLIIALLLSGLALACSAAPVVPAPKGTPAYTTPVPAAVTPNPQYSPAFPQLSSPSQPLPSIADVVDLAEHYVVAIEVETTQYDAFNRPSLQRVAGSGWVLEETGVIVTNNHVVADADKVTVTLRDGRVFQAVHVHTDDVTDLAIVEIETGGDKLLSAKLGDAANLRVGDWVVVIGNPLGLGISAKEGIISRLGVPISVSPGQTLHNLIETSAAINPGNSGGPLINMAGEVIGITSAKIGTVGVEGMGYAINIANALPVIEELVKAGCVVRPWLGMDYVTVDVSLAQKSRLAVNQGALVTDVALGSPASGAGMRAGDVIVGFQKQTVTAGTKPGEVVMSFDDRAINNADDLAQAEHSSLVGQKVTLIFWRGTVKKTVDVQLQESPPCVYRQ